MTPPPETGKAPGQRPIVVGNWKMNLDAARATALARAVVDRVTDDRVEVLLAPPYVYLERVAACLRGSRVGLAAQDLHWEPAGPFTGAISAQMLADVGASHVLVGHSERRQVFGETDAVIRRKLGAAQAAGLNPVLCVGESAAQRDEGRTIDMVVSQVGAALPELCGPGGPALLVAYEPVWAIGTGRVATPSQAAEVHHAIRTTLRGRTRVLYGGSLTPANAPAMLSEREVDGLLIGGASLDADSFLAILQAAAEPPPA